MAIPCGIFAERLNGNNRVMDSPQGYLNGRILPISEMALPVTDAGFILGSTVTEQMRTFSGRLFELDSHMQRLARSLHIVGIEPQESLQAIAKVATDLVATNHALLDPQDDLGLSLFVTPGTLPRFGDAKADSPCLGIHTFPLPFQSWEEKYCAGQSLVVTHIEQISPRCWPTELKCRSRMHYFLADQAANDIETGARALLLDAERHVVESSTANVLVYTKTSGIITPPEDAALPGISLLYLWTLAEELRIPWKHQAFFAEDVARADEVFLSSTPFGLLPVTRFNGQIIGEGKPGPLFQQLITCWSKKIGFDLVKQAHHFADRA